MLYSDNRLLPVLLLLANWLVQRQPQESVSHCVRTIVLYYYQWKESQRSQWIIVRAKAWLTYSQCWEALVSLPLSVSTAKSTLNKALGSRILCKIRYRRLSSSELPQIERHFPLTFVCIGRLVFGWYGFRRNNSSGWKWFIKTTCTRVMRLPTKLRNM